MPILGRDGDWENCLVCCFEPDWDTGVNSEFDAAVSKANSELDCDTGPGIDTKVVCVISLGSDAGTASEDASFTSELKLAFGQAVPVAILGVAVLIEIFDTAADSGAGKGFCSSYITFAISKTRFGVISTRSGRASSRSIRATSSSGYLLTKSFRARKRCGFSSSTSSRFFWRRIL